jgi:uncharacterized protein YceH (UPF0502 family)
LTSAEVRVLGCLLEKQRTTPDVYPLSLNSLRLACNQATNRDPVVDYDDAIIRDGLHRLERKGLVRLASGSRAAKYRHLLAEALPMDDGEQAVMCVLMLRGPQTPGELKQRGERIHPFAGLEEVATTLGRLIERGLVIRLARRPGQKEERYSHLLAEEGASEEPASAPAPAQPPETVAEAEGWAPALEGSTAGPERNGSAPSDTGLEARVAELERRVALLWAASAGERAEL